MNMIYHCFDNDDMIIAWQKHKIYVHHYHDMNHIVNKNSPSPPTHIVTYCKSINTQFTWSDLAAATTRLDLKIVWESAMWPDQTK